MEYTDPDTVLMNLRALAILIQRGYVVEWSELEPRGYKRPDHKPNRMVTLKVSLPAVFDSIRWELMKRDLTSRVVRV